MLLNSQLAAYAYKNAFHWIHVNMKRYTPPKQPPVLDKWEWDARTGQYVAVYRAAGGGSQTMIARNSYAEVSKPLT